MDINKIERTPINSDDIHLKDCTKEIKTITAENDNLKKTTMYVKLFCTYIQNNVKCIYINMCVFVFYFILVNQI